MTWVARMCMWLTRFMIFTFGGAEQVLVAVPFECGATSIPMLFMNRKPAAYLAVPAAPAVSVTSVYTVIGSLVVLSQCMLKRRPSFAFMRSPTPGGYSVTKS